MNTTYAQRQTTAQKKDAPSASSVLDASSQSESLQRKADMANGTAQRVETPRPNNTGMPDNLKAGIESLSGFSMDDVRVHYNSSKPATVQALAYTQGTDIHVAPGQEKHLPHEAWHVAQQMAGRVSPTTNINGMPVNDNTALEHEADVMGEKAVQRVSEIDVSNKKINYNFGNTCQMLRVINGYQQFWGQKRNATLAGNTASLRSLYEEKVEKAFNDYWNAVTEGTVNEFVKKRAEHYCPEITIWAKDCQDAYGKYTDYINKLKCSISDTDVLGKQEMLVINAHGSKESFADMGPYLLAYHVEQLLPNDYSGLIYLAGCCTGEREINEKKEPVVGSSFIEQFRAKLVELAGAKKISPSVKGNKNTAISTKKGVCVLTDEVKKIKAKEIRLYFKNEKDKFLFFKKEEIDFNTDNLFFPQCECMKLANDVYENTGKKGNVKIEKGKFTIKSITLDFDEGSLMISEDGSKWHYACLRGEGVYISGKQTKLHI